MYWMEITQMKITHSRLVAFLQEAIELSDANKEKAIAALRQELEKEGGAMAADAAKETAEIASGVSMDDDDFTELAQDADIETHKSGDVVDTSGLAEEDRLQEAMMVSLKPITSHPDTGKASTQKSRWAKLSGIPEEHINLSESIMDTTPMEDLMGTMAGEIADRFGNEMERLWDEDPAMMREQGYTDRSQWSRQVGSAELALEDELQQVMKQAVEEVETRLHDGQFCDERDSRSSMGGRDSNSDGKLDADELRDIADDLEG